MKYKHKSVLLQEVIKLLDIQPHRWYIDATVGGGGYTKAILDQGGCVLGIDQDIDAIEYTNNMLQDAGIDKNRYRLVNANFSSLSEVALKNNIHQIAGVVFDLGLSSFQIEQSGRGFSFLRNERLDMRMNKSSRLSAYDVINKYSADELAFIFEKYGEEHKAKAIADEIIKRRKEKKIETTDELVSIIKAHIKSKGKIHPATRIFQALRIEVNDEITNLRKGLEETFKVVETNGKVIVVTFHSLEDRVVKLYFQKLIMNGLAKALTSKPKEASDHEVIHNPRARSARLRGVIKL